MKQIFIIILIFNVLIMNAQELTKRDKTNPIQLTDKLSIYQEAYKEKKVIHWKLYLDKKGENTPKLLEEYKTQNKRDLYITDDADKEYGDDPDYKNFIELWGAEDYMYYPNLIDAYMEGKYLYVFVYKDHKAMLEIYYFKNGVKFEKTGYLLYPIESGSVMNFGGYGYSVNIRKIGEFHYVCFGAWRDLLGPEKFGLLRIKESNIEEIKVRENSPKTIFYPYRRIKEIEGDVSEIEKKTVLFKELKNLFKEHNLLAPNALIHSAGYINYVNDEWIYYIFYKTTDEPNKIKLIKYGNYLNNKPGFGWLFCDYTEEVLAPAYSHWNPK